MKFFNATNGPVTIDANGRTVGGGEWLESKQTPEIKGAVQRGELVVVTQPKPDKTNGNEGA